MSQDVSQGARTRWLPVAVGVAALVPAGILAFLFLLDACLGETDGTGGPSPRQDVCYAWDGGALLVGAGVVVGLALCALVLSARRGASPRRTWLLAALPAAGLVLVPLLTGLLPLR